jgi:hypothetical protein
MKTISIIITLLVCTFTLRSETPHRRTFSDLLGRPPQDTVRIGICHKQGHNFVYKLISKNSLNGHLGHGDFLYRGRPDVLLWEMSDWCNKNRP